MNSGLKVYTCDTSRRREQCIGILELKSEKKAPSSNSLSSTDGQRFVASGTQMPVNNYKKMNEDELTVLPYFQNYQKGIPSKVSNNIFHIIKLIIIIIPECNCILINLYRHYM